MVDACKSRQNNHETEKCKESYKKKIPIILQKMGKKKKNIGFKRNTLNLSKSKGVLLFLWRFVLGKGCFRNKGPLSGTEQWDTCDSQHVWGPSA